jgi:hypothetical protein
VCRLYFFAMHQQNEKTNNDDEVKPNDGPSNIWTDVWEEATSGKF